VKISINTSGCNINDGGMIKRLKEKYDHDDCINYSSGDLHTIFRMHKCIDVLCFQPRPDDSYPKNADIFYNYVSNSYKKN